ncbi:MAG: NAD(P)H-quinone oxidoreductase [Dehalococcoidia bacterium]|nr:NAD(P)H-quinone oxidoreductase [Dehalococcoidia bacterium]
MKAIVVASNENGGQLEYRDVPDPVAGPEDLLIDVKATALNRGDILQRMGGYPQPGPKPEFEIPGLECAGEVVQAGARTIGFEAGDRVMALLPGGGYAEKAVVHYRHAAHVPKGMSWAEAGATPEVFITAHDALRQCNLQSGESVLIHAAGSGVGNAAIQIAKVLGAQPVLGTAGSADKLEKARELGLDIGINYREQDFAEVVSETTGGRGVDVLLDVIGADYWERNIASMAPLGRMIVVGLMGGASASTNLGQLLRKRLQIRGTVLRSRPPEEKGAAVQAFVKSVLPHIGSGRIRVVVDRTFPLSEAQEAQAYMESNANFGKIVLEP